MDEISDTIFTAEMVTLWQNISHRDKRKLTIIINKYFDEGSRAEKIINKMQNGI